MLIEPRFVANCWRILLVRKPEEFNNGHLLAGPLDTCSSQEVSKEIRVDVALRQPRIGKVDQGNWYSSANHTFGNMILCLIMRSGTRECDCICRAFAAAPCPPCPLNVVRRGGRNIAHEYRLQLPDVDTH